MQGYAVKDLEEFLDYCLTKGLLKRNTAVSRKTAVSKILGVLDADEKADVRGIDMKNAFNRWQNKEGKSYDPASLAVYESRLNSAVRDFLKYKSDPKSYRPATKTRKSKNEQGTPKRPKEELAVRAESEVELATETNGSTVPPLVFSVPIRAGVAAWVRITGLPRDMTAGEASMASNLTKTMIEPLLMAAAASAGKQQK